MSKKSKPRTRKPAKGYKKKTAKSAKAARKAPGKTKNPIKETAKVTSQVQEGDTEEQKTEDKSKWSLASELIGRTRDSVQSLIEQYFTTIVKKKGARRTQAIKEVTVKLLNQGLSHIQIGHIFGFDGSYLSHLKAKDKVFAGKCETAKMRLMEIVEGILAVNAMESLVDPRYQPSMKTFLAANNPKKYGDQQNVRHTDSYTEMVEMMDPAHLLRLIHANALDLDSYKPQDLLPVIDVDPVEAEHETTYVPRK